MLISFNCSSDVMDVTPQFPEGSNGDVFRRMVRDGDDLSKPRNIDFYHVFPERKQALGFAEAVDDRGIEIIISYYAEKEMWQSPSSVT